MAVRYRLMLLHFLIYFSPMIVSCFGELQLSWRATIEEARAVKSVFLSYERASGQQVNFMKSSLSFSKNAPAGVRSGICAELRIPKANEHEKYLGVPTNVGRQKKALFCFMKERLQQRMQGWSARMLSRAGKEILLKSVAQAMPNHLMSVYLLPKDLCAELERMMNSFWWGGRRK